jgi:hypothetical protein
MAQIFFPVQTYDINLYSTYAEENPSNLVAAIHCFSPPDVKKRLVFGFCKEGSALPENSMKTEAGVVVFRRYVHESGYAWVVDVLRNHVSVNACALDVAPFAHGLVVPPTAVGLA